MRTTPIVLAAALALAGPVAASDYLNASAGVTIASIDPAVDGHHSAAIRVWTDAAGTPQVTLLVDGQDPTTGLPAPPGGLPPIPGDVPDPTTLPIPPTEIPTLP